MSDTKILSLIELARIEEYLNTERAKAEQAAEDARRAEMYRIEAEREARIAASRRAEQEERDAGDTSLQAAKLIQESLGDRWGEFMHLLMSSNLKALKASLARLEREREHAAQRAGNEAAPIVRAVAKAAKEISIATEIEKQLVAAGVMRGLTADSDIA